ncbi:MAG: TIGR03768 family metallophosphoesterase [bacterium]
MKKNFGLLFVTFIIYLTFFGCENNDISNSSTITSSAPTTLESTVVPVFVSTYPPRILPNEVSKYSLFGYGTWYSGPGIPYQKRLDLMPFSYTGNSVTKASRLLHFFTMTDIHITDVQSPNQVLYDGLQSAGDMSAYSPNMLYSTQVLDAAVRTVNSLNEKQKINFGLFLGDAINNSQYNELRWYIDVLDGKYINPNSDPLSTANTDYMRSYQAAGLNKSIPWYQVVGNHDHFFAGVFTPNDYLLQNFIGQNVLNIGELRNGASLDSRGRYMGVIDGYTEFGVVIKAGPVENFSSPPQINANPERHHVNKNQWIAEFSNTSSNPVGHGLAGASIPGCYTFEPILNIPIKVIVFDDTQEEDGAFGQGAVARLTTVRFNWLVNELDKGQQEGKLMIIAAHIPIGIASSLFDNASTPSQTELIQKLHTYSNLILWVSGHVHRNQVTPLLSPDPAHPEFGFWEVETASLKDFPQMFRLFDIVRNSDNTISIFAANVNPEITSGSPAAKSRSYSIAAMEVLNDHRVPFVYAPTGAYNAELVKLLSPEMQEKIKNY